MMSVDITLRQRYPSKFKINAATNNIPTAFSTAAGSLVGSNIKFACHLVIISEITSRLAINFLTGDSSNAPASTLIQAYIPAAAASSFSAIALDDIQLSSTLYIQSDSGSNITSGLIYGFWW